MEKVNKIIFLIIIAGISLTGQSLTWKVTGRMPVPVFGGEAIVKDSLVYILGGYSDSLRRKVDLIQEYNPATSQWRLIGNMKLKRQGFFAGVHNDSVYIFGGVSGLTQFKDYLEMWSFSGGSGYLTMNPNFNRIYPSGEIYNNKLYLIGGLQNHKTDTLGINYLAEFDIPSRKFTYMTNGPFNPSSSPAQQMTARMDSTIYIFGGIQFGISQDIYRFKINSRNFVKLTTKMPKGRAGGSAVVFGNNKLFVFGGFNEGNNSLSNSDIYTVSGESITVQPGPVMNYPRREFMSVRYNNSIYVFGGNSNNQNVPYIERLDFLTDAEVGLDLIPEVHILEQNYPNPFNPTTTIRYRIDASETGFANVSLIVYDIMGNIVAAPVNQEQRSGLYTVDFDGRELCSGVYFYKLTVGEKSYVKKMLLIK